MLNLMNLTVGQKLRLRNGAVGEVTENLNDGIWVQLRIVSAPEGVASADEEELVHCEEIVDLAE